jgi:serine/threonine protein kinase
MVSETLTPVYNSTSQYGFSSLASLSVRPSRVWNDSSGAAASYTRTGLAAFAATATGQTKALESVVDALRWSGLPGPMVLAGSQEYLGQGSQFVVYKSIIVIAEYESFSTRHVAFKQPKFDLDPDVRLDLAKPEMRKHLHDMFLEIFALTNPALRGHPNIARLFAWSTESSRLQSPPALVMELAESNLATFLEGDAAQISSSRKYSMCHDIGAGLDAIHDCRLVHGDLKPENVLIFRHKDRVVAKLADFGLSVDEAGCDTAGARLGGTPGWQAPEVEAGSMLDSHGLLQADNYSFGLLVWSIMLHSGKRPPESWKEARQVIARRELDDARDVAGLGKYPALADAVGKLLEYDSHRRPLRVVGLLSDSLEDGRTE